MLCVMNSARSSIAVVDVELPCVLLWYYVIVKVSSIPSLSVGIKVPLCAIIIYGYQDIL